MSLSAVTCCHWLAAASQANGPADDEALWLVLLTALGPALLAGLLAVLGARFAVRREARQRQLEVKLQEQRRSVHLFADGVYDFFRVEHDLIMKGESEELNERWVDRSAKLLDMRRHLIRVPEPWHSPLDEVVEVLYSYDDVAQWSQAYNAYKVLSVVQSWTDVVAEAFKQEGPVPKAPEEMWIVRVGLAGVRENDGLQADRPDVQRQQARIAHARERARELRDAGTWRVGTR
jgi:hypothetical protein